MSYQRTLSYCLDKVSSGFPVLLLSGPRQVGKTTLLAMCADSKRGYVTLDDLQARTLAQNDPALFLQSYPPPVTIDEVQYAPQLFSQIKLLVDREQANGMFWLTGSQKFNLMRGISESLAGRVALLDLLGLSQAELAAKAGASQPFLPTAQWLKHAREYAAKPLSLSAIYQRIWRGAFPKLHSDPEISRDIFYRSYVQTYIQRDVRDLLGIKDQLSFNNFLTAVAARSGQLLNYANLARAVQIDNKTAKSWLSVLEACGLVYLLQPYHNNRNKRLAKTPKLYFLDTGLCAYLGQWPDANSLANGAMAGAMLETYVFAEILKSYWNQALEPNLYFYRDADQREVDLIIESAGKLYPIEIKRSANPANNASKSFRHLSKTGARVASGAVICLVERDIPLSAEVHAVPVGYL